MANYEQPLRGSEQVTSQRDTAEKTTDYLDDGSKIIYDERLTDEGLLITPHIESITKTIFENQLTILIASTGVGKTTGLMPALSTAKIEDPYTGELTFLFPGGIRATQPRRLAVTQARDRVAQQYGEKIDTDGSKYFGFHHGYARETAETNLARFYTDGVVVNQLNFSDIPRRPGRHLIIEDEIHEGSIESELLVALRADEMIEDPEAHTLLMTATGEASAIAEVYRKLGISVAVIELTVNTPFPITHLREADFFDSVVKYASQGVQGVLPGKGEIEIATAEILKRLGKENKIPIFPLHGDQTAEEQNRALHYTGDPRIILSTNIGTTSLTPLGIGAIVNSNVKRQSIMVSGKEVLAYQRLSKAEVKQGAGRVGRVAEGISVEAPLPGILGIIARQTPPDYDTAAIHRTPLDNATLLVSSAGRTLDQLKLMHTPGFEAKQTAKDRLKRLGALSLDDEVTEIGKEMVRIPLDTNYARMVVEASRMGVEVEIQMIATAAIQHAKGIIFREYPDDQKVTIPWKKFSDTEHHSNALQELDVFYELTKGESISNTELRRLGIIPRHLFQAKAIYDRIRNDRGLGADKLTKPDDVQRHLLIGAIISGSTDGVFVKSSTGKPTFKHGKKDGWQTDQHGAVPKSAKAVVGQPIGIEVVGEKDIKTRWIVNGATAVTVEQLRTHMPTRIREQTLGRFSLTGGEGIKEHTKILVDNEHTGLTGLREVTEQNNALRHFLAQKSTHFSVLGDIATQIKELKSRSSRFQGISIDSIKDQVERHLPREVINLASMGDFLTKAVESGQVGIHKVIAANEISAIMERTPAEILVGKTAYSVTYNRGVAQIKNCDPADHATIVSYFNKLGTDIDIIDKSVNTFRNGKRGRHTSSKKQRKS